MCISTRQNNNRRGIYQPSPAITAAATQEASRQAGLEATLRRRRAGAAADILTGPMGIPATATLGGRS